jgi:ABC-2 type transport system ATP-binding protein
MRIVEVTRRYGSLLALDGVSFAIGDGEILGLLGANGAGKSTLLRIAAGLQPADAGRVEIAGVDLAGDRQGAQQRVGYAAEEPDFYEELSVDEHLAFVAAVRGLDPATARERAHDLYRRFGLEGRADESVSRFSHGMRKKLSFLAAVLHRPPVLLCDEALEGFDVSAALEAKDEIRRLAAAGTSVLFSSHVTETIERLCDRALILHQGRVVRSLERAAWGSPGPRLSSLETAFLTATRSPSD